ncbi:Htur_1727 family rSAM-partnered candidate RiPP [Halosimplex litoreum]|uniref:Htur_1727 family rSAM-partnered candidate RiPP n=1 Tax=Halosimplex litoreum TaxID=1198301 RepID=A0A7T3FZ27_9EURY|nr:Htur_1727 family rSAM-partnered candidate RiPP [Halosimplex litoreum]QPV63379.1 Htur_1727 family rSAM-partnered candidate RiPP [Halosimplex litoreum]
MSDLDIDLGDREPGDASLDGIVGAPRGDVTREWELFVRETAGDPLTHAGSVSAPSAEIAREQAERLFGWSAETLWLCPADETRRFAADGVALSDRAGETGATDDTRSGDDGGEQA